MSTPLSINQLTDLYREDLANCVTQMAQPSTIRQLLGERQVIHHSSYTCIQNFGKLAASGLSQIKRMQLAIEQDELDKIRKMDLSSLPGLQAIIKANLIQHHCGINHTQMLLIFENACVQFEQGDVDTALGIFIALLFLNPFIAALWYCVARAFESKGNLEQSFYNYAMCELLTKGNIYSALDAVECLIAKNRPTLARSLLFEIETDLKQYKLPAILQQRAQKLKMALEVL